MNLHSDMLPKINEIPRLLELQRNSGYEFSQNNGQRVFGPPPEWKGPPPQKGSEVFVGKLPRDCFEDELVPFMEKIGKVYETRLMMDFSGTNRGYAFVLYTNPQDAGRAVKELNNSEIREGRTVGVVKSTDNCRLFIGGVPKTRKKEEIYDVLSKLVEGVTSVILYSCLYDKSKNRGFAFVEFDSHRSAAMARRKLLYYRPKLWGYEVAVDWADPEIDVDEHVMSKVTALYVRNLMISTTEERIMDVFQSAGGSPVDRVKKIRDFAFVHFSDRKAAERAFSLMNGIQLDGAVIEVAWAKPVNRVEYQMHKAFVRPNHQSKDKKYPGTYPSLGHGSVLMKNWNEAYSRPFNTSTQNRDAIREAAFFGSQNQVPRSVLMPLNPEVNSKEGCCFVGPTNRTMAKEKTDCCEETISSMIFFKQVAVTTFPIPTAGADPPGFTMLQTSASNGFDQPLIPSGAVIHSPMLIPPTTSSINGVLPDVAITYAVPPPAAFYMHST